MPFQRYLFYVTKQCLSRQYGLKSNLIPTYSLIRYYCSKSVRKYTDRHEWVVVEQGASIVGITNYAQESLGDIVFAQLPDPGTELKAGDECGALESVKAASEIYSPVTGIVTDKNKEVESKPALINTSCYDQGWLFKLKLTKPEELKGLMTEEQYETFLKTDIEKQSDT